MAEDKKISELQENPSISGAENVVIEKSGSNFKETFLKLKDWILGFVTTDFIQTKRPIKTVNNESLEGSGNINITGGSSAGFETRFDSATTPPPSTGRTRFNNSNYALVTEIYVDKETNDGKDITNTFPFFVVNGSQLYLQDNADSSNYASFNVVADVVDSGTYFTVTVINTGNSGTLPTQPNTPTTFFIRSASTITKYVEDVFGGANVDIDKTDPFNPIISTVPNTSAGIWNLTYLTADVENIGGSDYYKTNRDGQGTTPSATPSVSVGVDASEWFAQDFLGDPYPIQTTIPQGDYVGVVSLGMTNNTIANPTFLIEAELYLTDANGTPVDSGVIGQPDGSYGVQLIAVASTKTIEEAVTVNEEQYNITAVLPSELVIPSGYRVRYRFRATKNNGVGNSTVTHLIGTEHQNYVSVPLPTFTSGVTNDDPTEFSGLATQYDINRWLKNNGSIPNAAYNVVGGVKMSRDSASSTTYISFDGTDTPNVT